MIADPGSRFRFCGKARPACRSEEVPGERENHYRLLFSYLLYRQVDLAVHSSAIAKSRCKTNNAMPIDSSAQIALTARIHPDTVIGPRVSIWRLRRDRIRRHGRRRLPHRTIRIHQTLDHAPGERNEISAGTVLGTDPLDKNFKGDRSYLRIGNGNKIREHFTISRGTAPESETVIGDENYIMTSGHIAHNCRIGNRVVIASCSLVSGYVEVEDQAFISGGVAIHQFCRIGKLAMIGGMTRVNMDAPPYFMYAGLYVTPEGLNRVGLRRAGFSREEMSALKAAYKILYRSGLKLEDALTKIESDFSDEHTRHLAEFVRGSKRGIGRPTANA